MGRIGILVMADSTSHPDDCPCFGCKCRYWRRNGAPGVHFQGGKYLWGDMTTKQFAQRELDMAAAQGRELVPVDANGDRYY